MLKRFMWVMGLMYGLAMVGSVHAANVLLLDDEYADEVEQSLLDAGHSVTRVNYWDWNGTNPEPAAFDVVFIIQGDGYGRELGGDEDSPGYAALISYVQAGGVLVTTEWLAYSMDAYPRFLNLDPILPFDYQTYDDYDYAGSYTVLLPEHPLAAGLPMTWNTHTDADGASCVDLKPGATVVIQRAPTYYDGDCPDTHAVAYLQFGEGLSIHFNTDLGYEDGETPTDEHLQIIANIVAFAESRGEPEPLPTAIPVPVLPLWALMLLVGLLGLGGLRALRKV